MAAESERTPQARAQRARAGRVLRLAAAAGALLALSEVLWLWQTWPVRELLQAPAPATPVASGR